MPATPDDSHDADNPASFLACCLTRCLRRSVAGGRATAPGTGTNPDGSGQAPFDFSLPSFAGDVLSIGSPAGWTDISGLGFINWYSTFPDDGGPPPDIMPGQTLTGFFFTSAFGPGDIPYWTVSTVEGDPFNVLPQQDGLTVGPVAAAPVPEPGTMLLVGSGLFGAWQARRRRLRA